MFLNSYNSICHQTGIGAEDLNTIAYCLERNILNAKEERGKKNDKNNFRRKQENKIAKITNKPKIS